MIITAEQILSWGPYRSLPEARIRELIGSGITRDEVFDLPIPANIRLWMLLREEVVPEPILHKFACRCAEQVLPLIPEPDPRIVAAIETKRRWLRGDATDTELDVAADAATDAARAALDAALDASSWSVALDGRDAAWDECLEIL